MFHKIIDNPAPSTQSTRQQYTRFSTINSKYTTAVHAVQHHQLKVHDSSTRGSVPSTQSTRQQYTRFSTINSKYTTAVHAVQHHQLKVHDSSTRGSAPSTQSTRQQYTRFSTINSKYTTAVHAVQHHQLKVHDSSTRGSASHRFRKLSPKLNCCKYSFLPATIVHGIPCRLSIAVIGKVSTCAILNLCIITFVSMFGNFP